MTARTLAITAIAAAGAASLSGCFTTAERPPLTFADLDRAATDADTFPTLPPRASSSKMDETSSRLVGRVGDRSLFLARTSDPETTCLTSFADEDTWNQSCGVGGFDSTVDRNTLHVVPDGGRVEETWTPLSENVFIDSPGVR
ncbi:MULTISPECIES: hypothetical protein [unclassified Rathayibacter]|uniref:hypothetical protein n=1 Tax=unclassified Rathayibacter TaxID=2609250 RepID=UPI000CE8EA79|nr:MULTISPECIES: hypothetical protein [unclassified Rathayibacter]PPF25730.1 hypothetical protein C5C54_14610 [Rathayibacter sp. AY1F2]PPF52902.1 hypothetical protein C5C55_14655 [Rathayibacter sp. AY1C2]PPG49109.1 hypothetical protein C5C41_16000 [Rathayibacter sp. AY1E9]PPG55622.1 hypothetical protein C5C57_17000 [Rathayibacter sp. AY1C5]PPG55873.1 hypothetical protein C5C69_16535 [Rathayibacter sp. AY1C7]